MDDLSLALNNSGIEGYLGDAFLNNLCYADDICLISLSSDNVVRYYIVYSMYGFITLYAYLFSSICVIMNTFCKYRKKTTRIASRASCVIKRITLKVSTNVSYMSVVCGNNFGTRFQQIY